MPRLDLTATARAWLIRREKRPRPSRWPVHYAGYHGAKGWRWEHDCGDQDESHCLPSPVYRGIRGPVLFDAGLFPTFPLAWDAAVRATAEAIRGGWEPPVDREDEA